MFGRKFEYFVRVGYTYMYVCMTVSKITVKWLERFSSDSQALARRRSHYIFGEMESATIGDDAIGDSHLCA